jgi:hypothetical protein
VTEVISYGRLEHWGKTAMSTRRRTAIPSILHEDLQQWRQALLAAGRSAGDSDFIIPGDLTGTGHGVLDPATGAVYLSRPQAKKWSDTRFRPVVQTVAKRAEFASIVSDRGSATPPTDIEWRVARAALAEHPIKQEFIDLADSGLEQPMKMADWVMPSESTADAPEQTRASRTRTER